MQSFDLFFGLWQGFGLAVGLIILILIWFVFEKPENPVTRIKLLPLMLGFAMCLGYAVAIIVTFLFLPSQLSSALWKSSVPAAIIVIGILISSILLHRKFTDEMKLLVENEMQKEKE
ncbi:MAG: hypothetical protein ACFFEJ_14020 [Candidatus Thorarchaeota archaeon]